MPFVVEDGTAKSDATSYVATADAITYITDLYGSSHAFLALTTAEQERHLMIATRYIDTEYLKRWKGCRYTREQALDWPRAHVYDSDGYWIAENVIPTVLQNATIEMAIRSNADTTNDDLFVDRDSGTIQREAVAVGPIKEDVTYAGGKTSNLTIFPLVERLLADITKPGGPGMGTIERG